MAENGWAIQRRLGFVASVLVLLQVLAGLGTARATGSPVHLWPPNGFFIGAAITLVVALVLLAWPVGSEKPTPETAPSNPYHTTNFDLSKSFEEAAPWTPPATARPLEPIDPPVNFRGEMQQGQAGYRSSHKWRNGLILILEKLPDADSPKSLWCYFIELGDEPRQAAQIVHDPFEGTVGPKIGYQPFEIRFPEEFLDRFELDTDHEHEYSIEWRGENNEWFGRYKLWSSPKQDDYGPEPEPTKRPDSLAERINRGARSKANQLAGRTEPTEKAPQQGEWLISRVSVKKPTTADHRASDDGVDLRVRGLNITALIAVRCYVTDPDEVETYRIALEPAVESMFQPTRPRRTAMAHYPFKSSEILLDGMYTVAWCSYVSLGGSLTQVASDEFEIRDGRLVR